MATLTILDVGHGNCSVIRDGGSLTVIDGGMNATLLQFLRAEGIRYIDHIFVSHADIDHVKGLTLALKALPDLSVGSVYVNPAQNRRTINWSLLVSHLEERRSADGTFLYGLHATGRDADWISVGESSRIEVVGPLYTEVLVGQNANTMSAVLRLIVNGAPEALFTADMDERSLDRIASRGSDLTANILVFAHHGGRSGNQMTKFGQELVESVRPDVTVISFGRDMFMNPQPDIITGIRSANHATHIACTQLSKRCCSEVPTERITHGDAPHRQMSAVPCMGSLTVSFGPVAERVMSPTLTSHSEFIRRSVPERLCERPDDTNKPILRTSDTD